MCLALLNVSQKAILLISDNKLYQNLGIYFHKPRMKTKWLIFRKFCLKLKKIAKRCYMARYCDESNGTFETLLKLFYGTLDDNRSNIAGCTFFSLLISLN